MRFYKVDKFYLKLHGTQLSNLDFDNLREIFNLYKGNTSVVISIEDCDEITELEINNFKVRCDIDFLIDVFTCINPY